MARGDELLEHVSSGGDGPAANELLAEFFHGYPLEKLRKLLYSSNDQAVEAGAFIAGELGELFAPLFDDVASLIGHKSKAVRFDSLDVVLVNATSEHGQIIAEAIQLVHDSDPGVRWKAFTFLARATVAQLSASLPFIRDQKIAEEVSWLTSEKSQSDITRKLADKDPLARMFSAVAAARLSPYESAALERARASDDEEVRVFAQSQLDALST